MTNALDGLSDLLKHTYAEQTLALSVGRLLMEPVDARGLEPFRSVARQILARSPDEVRAFLLAYVQDRSLSADRIADLSDQVFGQDEVWRRRLRRAGLDGLIHLVETVDRQVGTVGDLLEGVSRKRALRGYAKHLLRLLRTLRDDFELHLDHPLRHAIESAAEPAPDMNVEDYLFATLWTVITQGTDDGLSLESSLAQLPRATKHAATAFTDRPITGYRVITPFMLIDPATWELAWEIYMISLTVANQRRGVVSRRLLVPASLATSLEVRATALRLWLVDLLGEIREGNVKTDFVLVYDEPRHHGTAVLSSRGRPVEMLTAYDRHPGLLSVTTLARGLDVGETPDPAWLDAAQPIYGLLAA